MKPAPPVTRTRFGLITHHPDPPPQAGRECFLGGKREATVAAHWRADRGDGGAAVPGAAGGAAGATGGDPHGCLAGADAARRARGLRFYRRARRTVPSAAG